ncbi:cholecystokinin receptor-like isoform 2-T2 [Menidia menidia]
MELREALNGSARGGCWDLVPGGNLSLGGGDPDSGCPNTTTGAPPPAGRPRGVSVSISTFSLVAIAIERYSAICRPLQSRSWQTRSHACRVIGATWLLALVLMLPYPAFSRLRAFPKPDRSTGQMCRPDWPSRRAEQTWSVVLLLVLFLVPGLVMVVAYGLISRELYRGLRFQPRQTAQEQRNGVAPPPAPSSSGATHSDDDDDGCYIQASNRPPAAVELPTLSGAAGAMATERAMAMERAMAARSNTSEAKLQAKRRVVRMLMVIVALFFVCWMPVYSVNTWKAFDLGSASRALSGAPISFIHLLSYTSACVNPVIYCFMNSRFRKTLLATFSCSRRGRRGRHGRGRHGNGRRDPEDGGHAASMATSMVTSMSKFSYTTVSSAGT